MAWDHPSLSPPLQELTVSHALEEILFGMDAQTVCLPTRAFSPLYRESGQRTTSHSELNRDIEVQLIHHSCLSFKT